MLCTVVLPILGLAGHADGAVTLGFSGGGGAPLTITLLSPIAYIATQGVVGSFGPSFVFEDVGNIIPGPFRNFTGTITYTINGGPSLLLNLGRSGLDSPTITTNDIYIFGDLPGLAVGDTVVLNAGTLTTTSNESAVAPVTTSFGTFLLDAGGQAVSGQGQTVPEPASAVLLGLGAAGLLRRRRTAA